MLMAPSRGLGARPNKKGKGDLGALVHLSGGNAHETPSHSWSHVSGFTKINLYSLKSTYITEKF